MRRTFWPKRIFHRRRSQNSFTGFKTSPIRFWDLGCWKLPFGQNVLRTAWKSPFVKLSWKAHCFHVFETIWGPWHDFEVWTVGKCDLTKTLSARPEQARFVQFLWKAHCFTYWRAIQSGKAMFRKSNSWPQIERDELRKVHSGYCWKLLPSSI